MKFADILKEAFLITWRYKWFWLAGFIIYPQLVGGYPTNFHYRAGDEFPIHEFLVIMAVAIAVVVLVLLASSILQPALILATTRARSGTPLRVIESLRSGFDYFGRCLLISLLWMGCGLLLVIMLGIPLIIAFINSVVLGVVIALIFVPVAIAASLFVYAGVNYAYRNVVLYNMNFGESVTRSLQQFSTAKLPTVGLSLTAMVIPAVALFPVSLVFGLVQATLLVVAEDSGILMGMYHFSSFVISIPLAGYFGAFSNVLFTIAHYEWFLRERAVESPVPF